MAVSSFSAMAQFRSSIRICGVIFDKLDHCSAIHFSTTILWHSEVLSLYRCHFNASRVLTRQTTKVSSKLFGSGD